MKILSVLSAVSFSLVTVFAQENYSQWSYYKIISVNTTAGGANVPSNRVNYPLLVRISGAGFAEVFDNASPNGADIRFTKADGVTRLQHQIERWDGPGRNAEIWMYADNILGNNNTDFRIYWGRAGAADSSNAAATFPLANNFRAVWHMNGGAATSNETDVTANGFTATAQAAPPSAAGIIGLARTMNGTSQYFSTTGTATGILNFAANSNYTISAWVNAPSISPNRTIVQKSDRQYHLQIDGNSKWESVEYNNNNGGATPWAWQSAASTANATTGWHHVVEVRAGTVQYLYVDGALIATNTGTFIAPSTTARTEGFNVHIGRQAEAAARYWNGAMDEIRIISAARSADHNRLDYETQKAGVTCVTLGATVAQVAPTGLAYTTPVTYGMGVAIAANNPTVTGVVSSWSITPALPAGLGFNTSTGAITGTPTAASAAANYTVTATNAAGNATATVNIRVLSAPSGLTYGANPATYGVNVAIAANNPTVTGTVQSWSVTPALPAGLSLSTTTGAISGTPTGPSNAANYSVTAQNVAGSVSVNVNIRVLAAPSGLAYSANPATYGVNVAIAANNPTVTGTVQSWSVTPALPAGLGLSATTGVITGTPTAPSGATNYTVTATNAGGLTTATVNIRVLAAPTGLSYSQNPVVYPINVAITPNNPAVTGTVQSYSVTPALPAGLTLSTTTGIITGTPTAGSGAQNYTVTAQNAGGNTTVGLNLSVLAAPTNLTYAQNPATYGVGVAIAANNPTVTGTVTGWSVSPPLPAGLALSATTGIITGNPTAASPAANYTVTAQNSVGQTTVQLNFTVLAAPSGLSYSLSPAVYTLNVAIAANIPSVTGTVTGYSITPALPAGLTLNPGTGVISGTPTAARAAQNYTITAANVAGSIQATLNLAVLAPPSNLRYATNPAAYGINSAITPNAPTVSGSVTGYSVAPSLPAGLTLDTATGVISGTPTVASGATNYTVTVRNAVGSTTEVLSITIIAPSTNFSYSLNPAIYPVGAPIAANNPTVAGTVDSFLVSPALPAGLSLNKTTGVITGTPTAVTPSTSFQITATNLAGNTTVLLNIAVVSAPTGLAYLQNPAIYGMGTAITPNTPTVVGFISNYVIAPALPAGLGINANTGTISGIPTVAATAANYVITGSNAAGSILDTVNITVLSVPALLAYNPNPAVYGVGVAITPNIPTVSGTVQSYSVSPALPAGLLFSTSTGVISGTATAQAPSANYTITAQNVAGTATVQFNLTVLAPPGPLTYSLSPAIYGMGAAITPNTPSITGSGITFSTTPSLPAGLTLNPTTGIITGTPAAPAAAQTYTITAQNVAGAVTFPLTLTVLAMPSNLQYSANPAVYAVNVAITPNTPTVTGTPSGYSVSPALPNGLLLNANSGIITGTPSTASPVQNYTVTAQNAAGSTTRVLSLSVLAQPSGLSYTEDTVIYTVGAAIAPNNPSVTGTIARYSVAPALPTGLVLDTLTGIISGTPTLATAAANYSVSASNAAGAATFNLRITVLSVPTGLAYSQNPAVYGVGVPIAPNVPTVTGMVTRYSIDSTTPLPAGLMLDTLTGIITGTPSAETPGRNYTVSATNASGSATFSLNITVLSPPSNFAYAQNPALYGVGAAITPNVPTVTGTVTGYTVTPALPAGLSLNAASGVISGTPTTESASGYLITARNAAGSVTVNLTITVLAPTSNFSYTDNPAVYTVGVAITNNSPSISGTPLGYSISPALPAGLVLSSSTGIISGTPTAQAPESNYIVTAQNVAGQPTTTTLTIEVRSLSSNFSYAQSTVVYALNVAITPNTPTVTDTVQGYSVSPALPQGLVLNTQTGEITGTPTAVSAATNYVITGTNASGSSSVTLNIAVVAAPMGLTYAQSPVTYPLNATITSNTPTVTGSVTGYAISPDLPAGLSLNPVTGVISGTPTDTAAAQNYVITAQNVAGQTTFTLNLRVLAPPTALSYAQNQATYRIGTAIPQNAPTVTGTALTYTIDSPLPAGLTLNPATGIISGTPVSVTQATTYTITATNVSGSVQTTITITVEFAIAINARDGINAFSLNSNGIRLAQIGLPSKARWAKVEISTLSGQSLGTRLHNLGIRNAMEWGTAALPQGLLLVKISLLDENRKILSVTLLKIPRLR